MTPGEVDHRVPIYDSAEFANVTPTKEILRLLAGHAGLDVKQIDGKLLCGSNYPITSQHRPKIIYQSKLRCPDSKKLKLATKRHAESQYGQREFSDIEPIPLSDLVKQLAAHPLDEPSPSNWNRISIGIALARPKELYDLLTKTVIPIVSHWCPDASLVIVKNSYRLQRFFAASRLLRRFTQIPSSSTFAPTGSLMYWATENPDQLFGSILDWSSWILFPYSHLIRMPNHGMEIIISGNDLRKYEPPAFPTSMLELDHGASRMGRGDSGYVRQGADISLRTDHYYGRRVWSHKSDSSMKLTSWTITRASELLSKLADPYSFAIGTQSDGNMRIEPDKIQLYIWTVDRIIRRTLSLQTSEARSAEVFPVFEVADLLGKIRSMRVRNSTSRRADVEESKWLFTSDAMNEVAEILSCLPHPWGNRMREACLATYHECFEATKASIWDVERVNADRIDLSRSRDGSQLIQVDIFFADLLRVLRNSAHGYFPDSSGGMVQTISTGDIGKSVLFLPSLWLMALLANPTRFIGLR